MNIFSAGTKIESAKVNENFEYLDTPKAELIIGEDIDISTSPLPVFIEKNKKLTATEAISQKTSNNSQLAYGALWKAQTFTMDSNNTISKIMLKISKANSSTPIPDATVAIYATTAGVPSGSALSSKTIIAEKLALSGSDEEVVIELDTPLTVTSGAVYAIVLSSPSATSTQYVNWVFNSTSLYAGGQYYESANSGSSWTPQTCDFVFGVYTYTQDFEVGKVYKSLAGTVTRRNIDGFLVTSGVNGDTEILQANGIVKGFTGLLAGRRYYLCDGDITISQLSSNSGYAFGRTTTQTQLVGQTFKVTSANKINKIAVKLYKSGSPTDSIQMKIYDATRTKLLYTATNTVDGAGLTASGVEYEFLFDNAIVSENTTYFFELSRTGALHSTNYYLASYQTTNAYSNGNLYHFTSYYYQVATTDLYFKIYTKSSTGNISPTFTSDIMIQVGVAISSTELLISKDIKYLHTAYQDGSVGGTFTTVVNCGFKPKLVRVHALSGLYQTHSASHGASDGVNNKCVYMRNDGKNVSTSYAWEVNENNVGYYNRGTIAFTETGFIYSATVSGSNAYLFFEAER